MKKSSRHQATEMLYGVNPVIEALRAERLPETIAIAEGARDERLRELLELARKHSVPVSRVRRVDLDRDVGSPNHQGVAARIAAPKYTAAEDLLDSIAARVGTAVEPLLLVDRK